MTLSRISTYGQAMFNWAQIEDAQKQVSDLRIQISSGKKAQHASGIARQANLLFNLENNVVRNRDYEITINTAQRRLTEMETTTQSIINQVSQFKATLTQLANTPNQEQLRVTSLAQDFYNEIAGYLNTEQENRYLFAGGKTETPPVKDYDTMIRDLRELLSDSDGDGISDYVAPGDVVGQPVAFFNIERLAERGDNAIDPNLGHPIREMQIIDFFTNDQTFGSLARSVTGNGDRFDLTTLENGQPRINRQLDGVGLPDGVNSVNPIDFKKLFYRGDDTALSVRIEDNRTVEYGVTAEERGFELALAAAALLSLPEASPDIDLYNNDLPGATAGTIDDIDLNTRIQAAMKMLEDAIRQNDINNLPAIQSEMGISSEQLSQSKERLKTFNLFYEQSISEIENTDITEAATMVAEYVTLLEGSFRAIGAVRQLSLANFIR